MFESRQLDELARRLAQGLPEGLKGLRGELESSFRVILENNLDKLNLVSREQFEASQAQLAATRAKLDRLEEAVAELERQQRENDPAQAGRQEQAASNVK